MDMNSLDNLAKRGLLLKFMRGFLSSKDRFSTPEADAYIECLGDDVSGEALRRAIEDFQHSRVPGWNNEYPPTAPQLAHRAELWQIGMHAEHDRLTRHTGKFPALTVVPMGLPIPEGMEPAGLVEIDFGHGRIRMDNKTFAEQEEILKAKGIPSRIARDATRPRLQKMVGGAPRYSVGDERDD